MITAHAFFVIKGVIGLVAVIGLIVHMNKSWDTFDVAPNGRRETIGQRLRYLTLLYFAVLLSGASLEQIKDNAEISLRNIGALGGAVLLVLTVIVSIDEARGRRRP